MLDYAPEFGVAVQHLATWVSEGKIKSQNTIIRGGLEKAESALVDLFRGVNKGKTSVHGVSSRQVELTSHQGNSWSRSRHPATHEARRRRMIVGHTDDGNEATTPAGAGAEMTTLLSRVASRIP